MKGFIPKIVLYETLLVIRINLVVGEKGLHCLTAFSVFDKFYLAMLSFFFVFLYDIRVYFQT